MNLYLSDFLRGINKGLAKNANDLFSMDTGSIFPHLSSQAKWQFAKGPNYIHLSDGNQVHAFETHGEEQDNDFPLKKLPDVPIHEFGKDALIKGTAQIHKADPGMIYFTLQDGRNNPTYTFKHVSDNSWRAIPKKSKTAQEQPIVIDAEAFMKGIEAKIAEDGIFHNILDGAVKGVDHLGRGAINTLMQPGRNPLQAAGLGLAAGATYDIGRRALYNTHDENANESFSQRAARYLAPTLAMGGLGMATQSVFPEYYKNYPLFKA